MLSEKYTHLFFPPLSFLKKKTNEWCTEITTYKYTLSHQTEIYSSSTDNIVKKEIRTVKQPSNYVNITLFKMLLLT